MSSLKAETSENLRTGLHAWDKTMISCNNSLQTSNHPLRSIWTCQPSHESTMLASIVTREVAPVIHSQGHGKAQKRAPKNHQKSKCVALSTRALLSMGRVYFDINPFPNVAWMLRRCLWPDQGWDRPTSCRRKIKWDHWPNESDSVGRMQDAGTLQLANCNLIELGWYIYIHIFIYIFIYAVYNIAVYSGL